jgi:hypothetical protein
MELDEVLNEDDATSFPKEDVIMMNYDGHPMSGMHRVCNLSPGALTRCG